MKSLASEKPKLPSASRLGSRSLLMLASFRTSMLVLVIRRKVLFFFLLAFFGRRILSFARPLLSSTTKDCVGKPPFSSFQLKESQENPKEKRQSKLRKPYHVHSATDNDKTIRTRMGSGHNGNSAKKQKSVLPFTWSSLAKFTYRTIATWWKQITIQSMAKQYKRSVFVKTILVEAKSKNEQDIHVKDGQPFLTEKRSTAEQKDQNRGLCVYVC